jgi:hypothetical protein
MQIPRWTAVLVALLAAPGWAIGQTPEIKKDSLLHSVLWHPVDRVDAPAIVGLGQPRALQLRFDDFSQSVLPLKYVWVHCDRNWQPSPIMASEFVRGFWEGQVPEGRLAFNTYQGYSHYEMQLPEESSMPVLSGNYYLKVFADEQLLLQLPVVFAETPSALQVAVRRPVAAKWTERYHEVDAWFPWDASRTSNPFTDVRLGILQNRDWNSFRLLAPRFAQGDRLDFDYNGGENAFLAGNVFRFVETKALPSPSLRVTRYELSDRWIGFVRQDIPAGIGTYVRQEDARGSFVPRSARGDAGTQADYVWLDLELKDTEAWGGRRIALEGDFNQYQPGPEHVLSFSEARGAYIGRILVKQGYLEYRFRDLNAGVDGIDWTEGSHSRSANQYSAVVYARIWGERYDRAVAFRLVDVVDGAQLRMELGQ